MSTGLWGLIAAVLLGAAVLVTHVLTLLRALRSELTRSWKLASLVPLVTPFAAWRGGARVAPIAWGVLVASYLLVRLTLFR